MKTEKLTKALEILYHLAQISIQALTPRHAELQPGPAETQKQLPHAPLLSVTAVPAYLLRLWPARCHNVMPWDPLLPHLRKTRPWRRGSSSEVLVWKQLLGQIRGISMCHGRTEPAGGPSSSTNGKISLWFTIGAEVGLAWARSLKTRLCWIQDCRNVDAPEQITILSVQGSQNW